MGPIPDAHRAPSFPPSLADACAIAIRDGFADYHQRFAGITRRAAGHFARRDWAAGRKPGRAVDFSPAGFLDEEAITRLPAERAA